MAEPGAVPGPRDAAVMEAILKEMGVEDYDRNVVHQMLEFSYRYITTILEDARVYSEHAQKKELDVADVRLAIQNRMDHSFTVPPPRDFMIEIARQKNATPLPLIPEKFGPRIPPERYCLTANNYKVKERQKPPSLARPQVTLAATFRLPLGKPTTVVSSMMHPQLSSPLLQGTAGTPTSSSVLGLSSNQQGINLLATQLQSPVTLQSASTTLPRQNMPTLTPLSSVSNALTSSSTDNTNTSTNNSNTLPLLNMPVLGKLQ